MKSFKEYLQGTKADEATAFMDLYRKKDSLNPFDEVKYKAIKDRMSDPMITHRKKVDAARLVPTRSGSKGDGGGNGGGGSGGGSN